MKLCTITILFLLSGSINIKVQSRHVIKFIAEGDSSEPIGTVIISVEKLIPLIDRPTDVTFGQSVKTNIETFRVVRDLIKQSKYRTAHPTALDRRQFLRIEDSDGFILNLTVSKYQTFFDDLRSGIKDKNGDQAVIDLFKYYY